MLTVAFSKCTLKALDQHVRFKRDFMNVMNELVLQYHHKGKTPEELINMACEMLFNKPLNPLKKQTFFKIKYGFIPASLFYYMGLKFYYNVYLLQRRIEVEARPDTCPVCQQQVRPIDSNDLNELKENGELEDDDAPTWICTNCKKQFFTPHYAPLRYYWGQAQCPLNDEVCQKFWNLEHKLYEGLCQYPLKQRPSLLLGAVAEVCFESLKTDLTQQYFEHASCPEGEQYGIRKPNDFDTHHSYIYRRRAFILSSPVRQIQLPKNYRIFVFQLIKSSVHNSLNSSYFKGLKYISHEINRAMSEGDISFFTKEKERLQALPETEEGRYGDYLLHGWEKMEFPCSSTNFLQLYEGIEKDYYEKMRNIMITP